MAERKKIVKYRKPLNLNIGVVFFVIIFIYIVFNIFFYLTKDHISVYEVEQGTIAENNTYQGMILRSETIYTSSTAGYIDYYLGDASRVGTGNLIYSIDENGDVANKISDASQTNMTLDDEDYETFAETISTYSDSYQALDFYNVYTFKEELQAQLMEAVNQTALESLDEYIHNAQNNQTFHLTNADQSGIVVYYTDGYETVTADTFQADMMNVLNYQKVNLKQNTSVNAGDAVYKLITSEDWQIILPVSEQTYARLQDNPDTPDVADDPMTVVQIQFKKDGTTCWVNFSWKQIEDQHYMVLSLNNNMIRFANDRFVEIELLIDEKSGLKIPVSAITEKEFFVVPKEYFLKGGNSNSYGVLKKNTEAGASEDTTFVSTELFYETEEAYYIDESELTAGTVLQKPDSGETLTLGATDAILGVYNINKGYAVFKQIEILSQNEEYAVVRTGTSYGLSLYDHIALQGDLVQEDDLIQ